jgi:uncharacterized protein (TIGR02246 family)
VSSTDEQQIRDLVASWMSASKAGDVAKVLSLMTDDAVFLVAGQPPFGKETFAETMKGPLGKPQAHIDGRSEIQEVHVSGDLAYAWAKLSVDVTPPAGKPIRRAGHTLSIFRKSDGRWQLARDANLLTAVGD